MNKQVLMACLAGLVFSTGANADAIPFFNVQYDASAIALTSDGVPGFSTQAGALGEDAVSLSADSVGVIDVATAGAIVGAGLLSTSVDVSSSDVSSAVASAHFIGSFLNGGGVSLSIDFTGTSFASGSGGASTTLFVSLTSNGVTLFSDYVQGPWQFAYTPLVGTTSVLDLTLSSEANAAFPSAGPGNASSFGLVSITGAVPETSTWLLFGAGLGVVALVKARAHRARRAVAFA